MSLYVKKNGVVKKLAGVPKGWNAVKKFNVPATLWEANADTQTSSTYPYIAEIATDYFSDDSAPTWQMNGVGTLPTETELPSINMVLDAIFLSTGVTLYATDQPTEDLVLETGMFVKGYSTSSGVGTEVTQTVAAGATSVTFTHAEITSSAKLMLFFDDVFIPFTGVTVGSGTVTYTFEALASNATAILWIVD